jgi:hypothetical protein
MAGVVATVPPTEAREIIATCRAAWGRAHAHAHASQSEGGEVDESALTIYIASCEKLEELGYSVEERSTELEIMLLEDGSPYDGDALVSPADFLNPGAVPLNELAVVMDVRPVREEKVCGALVQHKPAIPAYHKRPFARIAAQQTNGREPRQTESAIAFLTRFKSGWEVPVAQRSF